MGIGEVCFRLELELFSLRSNLRIGRSGRARADLGYVSSLILPSARNLPPSFTADIRITLTLNLPPEASVLIGPK